MAFDYSPELFDSVSQVRFAVADTTAPGLLGDETYDAVLLASAGDVALATRIIAGHLAARYAQEPDRISDDGSTISWAERVRQWRLIAQGTAVQAASSASTSTTLQTGAMSWGFQEACEPWT